MSGLSGGMGSTISDLIRQTQTQQQPSNAPAQGVGPGEPTQGGAYGQQGMYNTLATDMSRGQMGPYGFGGNGFVYQPFGNPYMQQQSPYGGSPFGGAPFHGGPMGRPLGGGIMGGQRMPYSPPNAGGSFQPMSRSWRY